MKSYEVVIPWFGVEKGDVIEAESINPAFKYNVRELPEKPVKTQAAKKQPEKQPEGWQKG